MSEENRINEGSQEFDTENTSLSNSSYNTDDSQENIITENQVAEQAQSDCVSENNTDYLNTNTNELSEESAVTSYEWNTSDSVPEHTLSDKEKSDSKGFKVFLGIMLTLFTASVITLTALVVSYVYNSPETGDTKSTDSYSKAPVSNNVNVTTSDKYDYSSVTIDNPNYVDFDFAEYKPGESLSIPEIAAKCSPSSVGIVSEVEVSYSFPFYYGSTGVSEASGSGFIYSSEGYIITNHHVIEDANRVTVILHDGSEYEAEIIGSDSLSDIAVLKITPDENTALIPMEIGNSDELVVGEPVVAIGCPAGIEFIGTVTDGIVSSINRNVEITDNSGTVQKTMTLIQTNATINHGNSGGPLINSRGQVIGINTLKLASDYEGIGFSIPMNGAVPVISQLIEHGEVIERTEEDFAYGKGIIGINGSAISEDESKYYGIPVGVLVVQIDKDSSASKAGLRRGDIITHYNGIEVKTVEDINKAKGNARPGTEVTLTVYRDGDSREGETTDITFKLDSQE